MIENLWPDSYDTVDMNPLAIFLEQKNYYNKKEDNVLSCFLDFKETDSSAFYFLKLGKTAEKSNTILILKTKREATDELYPVSLRVGFDYHDESEYVECNTREEFCAFIEEVFASDFIKQVILKTKLETTNNKVFESVQGKN